MNSTQGILNACIKQLSEIKETVNGPDVGHLPVMYGPNATDLVQLGAVYSERFFSCVTPSLRYPVRVTPSKDADGLPDLVLTSLSEADATEDNPVIPALSADPAILSTVFDQLKAYKRPTPKQIQRYADMTAERFTAALVEIITGKGRGPLDADAINWRCVYAGYIYLQVTEYLADQTATFALVPQSTTTNALARINTGDQAIDPYTRRGKIKVQDTIFELAGFKGKPGQVSTKALMLNDIFLQECRRTSSASIAIPLSTLARIRGKSTSPASLKDFRTEVLEQMAELSAIYYRGRSKVDGKWQENCTIRLNGGTSGIVGGVVRWNYNQDFYNDVTTLAPMDYPRELWKVDPRTNQFYFGRYIALNYRLNEGKAGRHRIRIKALVGITPNLPSYEAVMAGNRHVRDRIICKTFADLDALESIFYEVYTADGTKVEHPESMDYDTFINGFIEVDYSTYPTHASRAAAKERRAQRTKAAIERQQAREAAKKAAKK